MELFARIFVKLLDKTYRKAPKAADSAEAPLVDDVLRRAEEEIEGHRRQQIVDSFQSTAPPPQPSAIDYAGMPWEQFSSAVETPAQFMFYSGRNVAKIVEKSAFTSAQELAAFRRVVRRYVAECELLSG